MMRSVFGFLFCWRNPFSPAPFLSAAMPALRWTRASAVPKTRSAWRQHSPQHWALPWMLQKNSTKPPAETPQFLHLRLD